MSRGKGKRGVKKGVNPKKPPVSVVKINGRLDNLLDYIKQSLYHESLTFEKLYQQLGQKMMLLDGDRLERDLKRCLGNNMAFYFKNNLWQMDKGGNPNNDAFYQYLMTMGQPMPFRELLFLAEENGMEPKEFREQDMAYDGRFIRLRNGGWGLTYWHVAWEVGKHELNQMARQMQQYQRPLSLADLAGEILQLSVEETNLPQVLAKDKRFLQVASGRWYLKSLLEAMVADLTAPDEFSFIRQGELNVLQEAELMLIIEEADAAKREYILSSRDLEKGVIRLSKRMLQLFASLNKVTYTKAKTGNKEYDVWILKEQKYLAGLHKWFQEHELEPGSKVEISFSHNTKELELKASGERDGEVFKEGLRVKKLVNLRNQWGVLPLTTEEALTEILQLYPMGLDFNTLNMLMGIITGIGEKELKLLLENSPYFEETKKQYWVCNMAMRQAFQNWEEERQNILSSLDQIRRQVAVTTEEYNDLFDLKTNLEEELNYLQSHHREEEVLFQEKIEELAALNEHLNLDNNRLRNEYNLLEEKQSELMEHMEYQGGQLVALRTEKNKLKVKLERMENKSLQLQSNLNKLMEEAQTEVNRLKKELTEKTHRLDSLQYANQQLQKNLARLHEERRQMKRQVSSWPVRIVMFLAGLVGGRKTIGS